MALENLKRVKSKEKLLASVDEELEREPATLAQATDAQRATLTHADEVARDAVTAHRLGHDNNGDNDTANASQSGRTTAWGIPIPEGWDASDPVFRRHPMECDCLRAGVLRCAVPCVWAWPPGARIGDKP